MQKTNEPINFRDKTGWMETRTKQMTVHAKDLVRENQALSMLDWLPSEENQSHPK
jgi:hypothetical protein